MTEPNAPIIILGMHRSGTSCLAGSLQQAGLVLGDVHTANPFNKKGNREHPALMSLHESVLEANGGAWHCPPDEVVWQPEHQRQREAFIAQFAGVPRWGFKDPRTLLVWDGWAERFPGAKLVGTIRHPLSVAHSLHRRNPQLYSLEGYMALWTAYNRRLLALYSSNAFPIVDFDIDETRYRDSLRQVLASLGLREGFWARLRREGVAPAVRARLAGRAEPFFDPALRSERRESTERLPGEAADLYRELKQVARQSQSATDEVAPC